MTPATSIRRRADRRIDPRAVGALEDLYAQLRIVAIDEPLARHAGDLACALHLEGADILLATWDTALNAAARATGHLIANDTG